MAVGAVGFMDGSKVYRVGVTNSNKCVRHLNKTKEEMKVDHFREKESYMKPVQREKKERQK
eukprot:CAMPEP_0170562270 /NCGR_PEP_ID=MMETSP0211-20121228/59667_1 /TAXON_ID=311385 /ORGANISM="Pseudokeronopsis sp., Strain OXSARD2" /LENGTH=60 /DNA_ID=CAMNT_0010878927 /DNA_START=368 /DNA_END=550 /DNA_ORIENTATION=-